MAVTDAGVGRKVRRRVMPGLGLSLGITITWLGLIVLIPLLGIFLKASGIGLAGIWQVWSAPRVLAALKLSFGAALVAAVFNAVMGTWVAWVFVRYRFPGKRLFDAAIDLPFALPTAVAGIALTALYGGNGWLGRWLEHPEQAVHTAVGIFVGAGWQGGVALLGLAMSWLWLGKAALGSARAALLRRVVGVLLLLIIAAALLLLMLLGYGCLMLLLGAGMGAAPVKVAYTPLGIIVALVFVGLPFVVRVVQPVLAESERELEEAAAILGAGRWQTIFRVILPSLWPAILTGFALAFARGVGEYGSVIFIAGNMPGLTEIAPLLITIRLDEFDYAGATAIAAAMLLLSFVILLLVNSVQAYLQRGGRVRAT